MESLRLNKYINVLLNLYDITIANKEEPVVTMITTGHFFWKCVEEKKSYPKRDIVKQEISEVSNTFTPNGMSFSDMWQFCQFVRFAEKIIFYNNTPEARLYVDSDLDEMKTRQFVIKRPDYTLLFKLERATDPIQNDILEIIKLTVSREYGRKMVNSFTIVNGHVKYNDEADIYLIDNINRLLAENMSAIYWNILFLIDPSANSEYKGYNYYD